MGKENIDEPFLEDIQPDVNRLYAYQKHQVKITDANNSQREVFDILKRIEESMGYLTEEIIVAFISALGHIGLSIPKLPLIEEYLRDPETPEEYVTLAVGVILYTKSEETYKDALEEAYKRFQELKTKTAAELSDDEKEEFYNLNIEFGEI